MVQVVGVKGSNLAGDCLRAQQLVTCLPQPLPTTSPDSLRRYAAATGSTPCLCQGVVNAALREIC